MKKEKRNRRSHELIREMIELYHPQSIKDIQEMLKDMFAAAISSSRDSSRIASRTSFVLYSAVYVFRVMVLLLLLLYYTMFTMVCKVVD